MIDYITLRCLDFAIFAGIKLNDPDITSRLFDFESPDLVISYGAYFSNCIKIHYYHRDAYNRCVMFRNTQCYNLVYMWLKYAERENTWPVPASNWAFYHNLGSITL